MLSVDDRPQWRAIRGGSARYVEKLIAPFRDRIRLDAPVEHRAAPAATACWCKRARRGARALRPRVLRLPRRPGAARCSPTPTRAGARDPRRHSVPAERGRAAHRHVAAAARAGAPGRRGTITCCPSRAQRVALTYNMNILQALDVARDVLRDAEPRRTDRPGQHPATRLVYHHPRLHAGRRRRAAAPARDQRRRGAPISAARTGATASTRTASSARSQALRHFSDADRACTARSTTGGLATGAWRRARTRSATACSWCISTSPSSTPCSAAAGCGRRAARRWRASAAPTTSAIRRVPLDSAVRDLVEERIGPPPGGSDAPAHAPALLRPLLQPGELLLLLRCRRPAVEAVVAEVNNTPWGERHCYVLDQDRAQPAARPARYRSAKAMHVSPFMPMDLRLRLALAHAGRARWRAHGAAGGRTAIAGSSTRRCALERAPITGAAAAPARCCASR